MMNFFPTVQRKNHSNLCRILLIVKWFYLFLFRYFLVKMQATTAKTKIKMASIIETPPSIEKATVAKILKIHIAAVYDFQHTKEQLTYTT